MDNNIYFINLETHSSKTLNGALVIAKAQAGTSLVITLSAATLAPSCISTGATNTELEPILTSLAIIVLDFSFGG